MVFSYISLVMVYRSINSFSHVCVTNNLSPAIGGDKMSTFFLSGTFQTDNILSYCLLTLHFIALFLFFRYLIYIYNTVA